MLLLSLQITHYLESTRIMKNSPRDWDRKRNWIGHWRLFEKKGREVFTDICSKACVAIHYECSAHNKTFYIWYHLQVFVTGYDTNFTFQYWLVNNVISKTHCWGLSIYSRLQQKLLNKSKNVPLTNNNSF